MGSWPRTTPKRKHRRPWQRRTPSASHSMELSKGVFLLFQLVTVITPLLAQEYQCDPTPNGLSDNCIGCICEASTRCNVTTKCISGVRDLKHLFARSYLSYKTLPIEV